VQRLIVIGCVAAACVVAVAAVRLAGTGASDAEAEPELLTLTSRLPAWRAPAAPVVLAGFAGARERVALRANGMFVEATRSGRLGRFELRFAAKTPGRYRLRVVAGGRSRNAGTVVVRPVVVEAVGDITFGEQVGPAVARFGAAYPWQYVAGALRGADVTVGNLETAVSTRGAAAVKEYTFRGEPKALVPLHDLAGFDVLTLANNHAGDYGRDALLDTVGYVHKAGIQTIGAGADETRAHMPAVVERGGLKIAFLGYSDVNPLGFLATATAPGTAAARPDEISADFRAALRHADLAVCFFHWGVELHSAPDARQRRLAHACLDAGAALVLGAHPHVLGPVERPSSRSLVAWTLGNFVFPSSGAPARSAILRVELGLGGVRSFRLRPVLIDGFRPRLGGR
jgi:poly-gamma-glutamate capsule biosynthesis protein CapA/YwtB (metallophosphatase superfamily)